MKLIKPFIKIAQDLSIDELNEYMEQCEKIDMKCVREDVKAIYKRELKKRTNKA